MRVLVSACLGVLFVCGSIRADVVFSNLSASSAGGYAICGSTAYGCAGNTYSVGAAFTALSNYTLTEAQVKTFANSHGSDASFDAFLYSNSGGLPGAVITELAAGLTAPAYGGGLNVITAGPGINLTSGTEYWLVLTPVDSNSDLAWEVAGLSNVPLAGSTNGGAFSAFTDAAQFEIDGTPSSGVPEPSASWLATVMLSGAAIWFRKRRVV